MTLRTVLKRQKPNGNFFLIYWSGEDSVTAVPSNSILEPESSTLTVGDYCKVKYMRTVYDGRVAAIGSKDEMEKLSDDFIDGEYTPFQQGANPLVELKQNTPVKPPAKNKKRDQNGAEGKENCKKPQKKQPAAKKTAAKKGKTSAAKKPAKAPKDEGSIIRVVKHSTIDLTETPSKTTAAETTAAETTATKDATAKGPTVQTTIDGDGSSDVSMYISSSNSTSDLSELGTPSKFATITPVETDSATAAAVETDDSFSSSMDISNSSSTSDLSESDPLLFEIAVRELETKVLTMEAKQQAIDDIQQTILARLAALEQSWTYSHVPQPNWSQQPPYPYQVPQPYQQQSYVYQSPQPYQSAQSPQTCQPPQTPTSPSVSGPSTAANSSGSKPKPVAIKKAGNALSSSAINKEKLKPASRVIQEHPKLRGECKAGTLAVKLARQAIFGDAVLAQCTPGGSRELPALPNDELNFLKEVMFDQFSQYWSNPVEFESVWGVCFNAVGQACKRLR